MKTTQAAIVVGIYAALIAIGGIIGFVKAQSTPSLVAGLAFGLVMGFNSVGIYKGCRITHITAMILAALLTAFFSYRFYLSHAFMPAGLMILLSLITFLVLSCTCCHNKTSCTKQ